MSRFARRPCARLVVLGWAASVVITASVPLVAVAAVERLLEDPEPSTPPAARRLAPVDSSVVGPRKAASGSVGAVIRCYQYGRLVYESSGVSLGDRSTGATTLRPARPGGSTLQLLDLRHGLCILEQAG